MTVQRRPFKVALREDDRIVLDRRAGTVAYAGPDCVILEMDETLPVQPSTSEPGRMGQPTAALRPWLGDAGIQLSHDEVYEAWKRSDLLIPVRRKQRGDGRRTLEEVLASCTNSGAQRLRSRMSYVQVLLDLLRQGLIDRTRPSVTGHLDLIHAMHVSIDLQAARKARETAGLRKHASAEAAVRTKIDAPSARTLLGWLKAYEQQGPAGLVDNLHRSGHRLPRFDGEVMHFLAKAARTALREEGPTIQIVTERVRDAFLEENERREKARPALPPLAIPGREAIRSELARIRPLEYALRTRSRVAAERALRPAGQGPEADRALQSVFCDEWTVDLKVLLLSSGVWDRLCPEERARFVVDGKPVRLILSAAIDLATRAIVGLQFGFNPSANLTVRVIEMMLLDKNRWAEAGEGVCGWPMQGIPEALIMDRGSSYNNEQVYRVMSALGIDHLGCVAEMPHLKGLIERLFRAAHERLIARFSGRTHSHPHQRPDYDSDVRAQLTPELLIQGFLRFVVDIHHTTPRKELGGRSPLEAWEAHMREGFGVTPPPDTRAMRQVFGTALPRTLTPSGLRVNNLQYHSDELARLFMRDQKRDYEVRWWPHDIGAIEVHLGGETWLQVGSVRDDLDGVAFETVRASLMEPALPPEVELIQSQARRFIDGLDPTAATVSQLFESSYPPERIDAIEERLLRHMVTAEGRRRVGPARPLLGDVIEPRPLPTDDPGATDSPWTEADPDPDFME